jgi:predicted glycosyltransferase
VRILIAVSHLLGAGHLTRAAALARAFVKAGHDTVLVSGGMPAPLVRTDGVRLVQLPPVRTIGTDFTTLRDENGHLVTPARLEARRDALLELIDETRPDVLVTELFPFGRRALAGEFTALIEHAQAVLPDILVLASVRDILVAPSKPDRIAGTHETLSRFYDAVLVHGDPKVVPIEASWPLHENARGLLRYTGYVDDGAPIETGSDDAVGEVLVSGGSSAASLPLYQAAVAAAAMAPDRRWRVLVGTGVAEADFASLARSASPNLLLERVRRDFRSLLAKAAVSVSQAGYNTAVDVLRARCRAVFVPFEQGSETEQRLRAERLAAMGFGEVLTEAELSPASLAEAMRRTLRRPRPGSGTISLDGAARSVAIVEELAGDRLRPPGPTSLRSPVPWGGLDEALRRAADRGATIPFWWRDDDAIAHTTRLDRLIGLARNRDIPLAIAVIPEHADPTLAARLAAEPLVRILVHGLAHMNHAAEGGKKAEFGPDRPLAQRAADARDALRLAESKLSEGLLPVFVPPWNRIAPDLVQELPKLGFRGLSTFGAVHLPKPAPGLVQANTHVDPIDWRHGCGLRNADSLLADLGVAIATHCNDRGPVGLLTHHLVQDEDTWAFCEELLNRLAQSAIVRFVDPCAMFVGAQTVPT